MDKELNAERLDFSHFPKDIIAAALIASATATKVGDATTQQIRVVEHALAILNSMAERGLKFKE